MNPIKYLSLLILVSVFSFTTNAQTKTEKDQRSRKEGTISQQFDYVLQKSYTYRGNGKVYKNVERHWLTELKTITLDTLKAVHKDLSDTQATVEAQNKEITDLKSNLTNTQSSLDQTNIEKNNMALFGLQMSKTSYNVLMWSIIAGLLALLLFFIYKFNNSNSITKGAKKALAEIEEEFDEHRKTALEREQKVRRQLQDEINKQKGV